MDNHPRTLCVFTELRLGGGVITRKILRVRAMEVALLNGRKAHAVEASDWEQAKRELAGGPKIDRRNPLPQATDSPLTQRTSRGVAKAPEVHPSSPTTRDLAVITQPRTNSADSNAKADREAIEAWENEGDPN